MPYADFEKTAECLDSKRLGNQVYRECLTLIRGGWKNHPASIQWRGYEAALAKYSLALLRELTKRGRHYQHHYDTFNRILDNCKECEMPWWVGDERYHSSHRSILLAKKHNHYSKFNWKEPPAVKGPDGRFPYFWPSKQL